MRAYARRTLVFLAGLACLCVALETGLRLLGLVYRKNTCDFATDTRIPAKDDFFVLCLGDSWTYGLGAPPDKSYPRQLEEKLNRISGGRRVTVINDGYAGDNTWQMREKLFSRLSSSARLPDLVILMGGPANFWNFTGATDITPSLSSFMRRHSRAFRLAGLLAANVRKAAAEKRQSFLRSELFTTQLDEDIKTLLRRVPECVKLPPLKTNIAGIEPKDISYWTGRISDKPIEQIPLSLYRLCAGNAIALLLSSPDKEDAIRCARLLLGLGNEYRIAGQFDMAALYCLEALKYRQNDGETYQELSMILFKQGEADMALRFSLRRLCLCPTEDLFLISQIIMEPERLGLLQETIERFSLPVSGEIAAIVGMDNPRQQVWDWIRSDFSKMCSALRDRQIPVFFLGDFNTTSEKSDWQTMDGLSREFNAPYILTSTMFPADCNRESYLAGDRDHPNAKGYGFIADCIIREILKQGLISKR